MPTTQFTCPECQSTLRSPKPLAVGIKVKCPKCAAVFPFKANGDSTEEDTPPARPKAARAAAKQQDEVAEYDDGRGDDETAEEEFEEKRPRRKKKRKQDNQQILVLAASIAGVVLLLGGGAFAAFVWPGFLKGDPTWDDPLAFVPAQSGMILSAEFGAVSDQLGVGAQVESFGGQLFEVNPTWCKKETDLEFKELFHQVTFANNGALPAPGTGPAKGVMVVKSKSPFSGKKVRTFLKVEDTPQKLNGVTYYKKRLRTVQFAVFIPSNRLIVFADLPDKDLEPILAASGSKPAISGDLLAMVDQFRQGQFWGVLPLDAGMKRNFLAGFEASAGAAAQELGALKETVTQAKSVGLRLSLEGNRVNLSAGLMCPDAGSAAKLAQEFQKSWEKSTKGPAAAMQMTMAMALIPKGMQDLVKEIVQSTTFADQNNMAMMSAAASFDAIKKAIQEGQALALKPGAAGFPGAGGRPGGFPRPGGQPGAPGGRRPGGGRPR